MPTLVGLRQWIRAGRRAPDTASGKAVRVLDGLRSAVRCVRDSRHRAVVFAQLRFPDRLHQTTTLTEMDRYPAIFSACRRYFEARTDIRILSFGCSTGDEVLTLRTYFPEAVIIGAEINSACLAACRRLAVDDRISFVRSDPRVLARLGPFDAIFCMAVLQRTPVFVAEQKLESLLDLYPFEKFDRQIAELEHLVAPGGLLVVHPSQYRVQDAGVASRFEPWPHGPQVPSTVIQFDRSSRRIEDGPAYRPILVKRA